MLKRGFRKVNGHTYYLISALYKQIINIRWYANLEERVLYYEVYNCSNQKTYLPFYNNVNSDRNHIVIEVIEKVNALIDDLASEAIIME